MRRWFNRLPIATKLRTLITAACVVVVFFTCIALVVCEWIDVRRQLVTALDTRCRIISANASAAVLFNSPPDAEEILSALKADRSVTGSAIFRPDGTVFAQYLKPGATPIAPPKVGQRAELDMNFATVWVPMRNREDQIIGAISMRMSLGMLHARIRLYLWTSLGVMLVAGFLSYLLSHRLQRIISQPLLDLARAADRVTEEKDFAVRVNAASEDEIGKLAVAFNSMLATIQAGEAESARLYDQVRAYATGLEARVQERTAQLQSAYNEMESFSYSVSHDLRGPLRHIGTYSEMILEEAQGKLSPETLAYGERIQKAVKRMDELITALLAFARSAKQEPNVESVEIGKMCEEIAAELRLDPRNATTEVTIEPLTLARADPLLLRQVLSNLIGNAFKYSRKSAPARVRIFQSETAPAGHLVYAVQDNGVGFDAKAAKELFNVFVRLHDSREFEGSGVGLATVKRIIQRHGGRVWADSNPGQGATFYFSLPTADSASPLPGAKSTGRAAYPQS